MVATAPAYRHDGFMRPWGPLALLDITITLGFFGICLVLPACLQRFILYPGDNTYVTLFNFDRP